LVARIFLGAAVAVVAASPLGSAQEPAIPTFGTTVVGSGGLLGVIYRISPLSKFLPDFLQLDPLGVIYTSELNVTPRSFREGFPGVTDRFEWFAIDYSGRFWAQKPGLYRFEITSDDGSKLYIDGRLIVNNDGIHPPVTKLATVALDVGVHRIRISYFQGPRESVALVLRVAKPGEEWRLFNTEEFKPPPDATWVNPENHVP
jgi:PA14 domain